MSAAARCENCGAPLASADAVCSRCEGELSAPAVDPAHGKYRCPQCHGRFDQPEQTWLPRGAPWYWPQTAGAQCPHCKTLLRDRKMVRHSGVELAAVWMTIFASGLLPWRPGPQIALGVLYLLVELVRWMRVWSAGVAVEERFAKADGQ